MRYYFSEYYTRLGPRTCQTEQEAKQLQILISSEIINGTFNPLRYRKTKPLHLKKFAEEWIESDSVKTTLKYATWKTYRAALNNWIIPILGDVFTPDLNQGHYLKLWTGIDRSPKYKKNIITTLYTMLEDARRAGVISQVPEKIIFKGKFAIPKKDPEWIDIETQERILREIPKGDRPLFQFMMITGVRPSEARALRKKDLHPDKGYITIKKTFAPVPGGEEVKEVKQKRDRRIPFYRSLTPILESIPGNLTPYVFVNPRTGRPYTKNINRNIWNPACQRIGIKISLNNATRHSWGNQLSAAGIDMEIISLGLGHSTTGVTKEHYATPSIETLKNVVDNLRRPSSPFASHLHS